MDPEHKEPIASFWDLAACSEKSWEQTGIKQVILYITTLRKAAFLKIYSFKSHRVSWSLIRFDISAEQEKAPTTHSQSDTTPVLTDQPWPNSLLTWNNPVSSDANLVLSPSQLLLNWGDLMILETSASLFIVARSSQYVENLLKQQQVRNSKTIQ